jgi:polyisoprenoid-binding protein YceI
MKWNIDPNHAAVDFAVKHMAISTVKGAFKSFTASGETNEAGLPTSLSMQIDATSISTNNAQRDAHLNSPDFFNTSEFPTISFESKKVEGTRDDLKITGDLTMRGVTRTVTLKGSMSETISDPWGNPRASLAVSGKISRSEWGLTWNQALEFGGLLVSDDVKLEIEAQAVAVKPEQASESKAA